MHSPLAFIYTAGFLLFGLPQKFTQKGRQPSKWTGIYEREKSCWFFMPKGLSRASSPATLEYPRGQLFIIARIQLYSIQVALVLAKWYNMGLGPSAPPPPVVSIYEKDFKEEATMRVKLCGGKHSSKTAFIHSHLIAWKGRTFVWKSESFTIELWRLSFSVRKKRTVLNYALLSCQRLIILIEKGFWGFHRVDLDLKETLCFKSRRWWDTLWNSRFLARLVKGDPLA